VIDYTKGYQGIPTGYDVSTPLTEREQDIRAGLFHKLDNEREKQTAALLRIERLLSEGLQALHRGRVGVTEERMEVVLEAVTKELSRIQKARDSRVV
jgi:hypothetical protein